MTHSVGNDRSGSAGICRPIASGLAALGLLACLVVGIRPAAAADSVFTVANYPVEARAENAVVAKDRALAQGQQAAFRSLLKRLVPVAAYTRVRQLGATQVGNLIESYKVRSERNSATDYVANLDFAFQAKGVRDLLRRENIPFTDEQAPDLTLVPVWRTGAAPAREDAAWTNVWRSLDLEHTLTPVKLQSLRREIKPEAVNALAAGDGSAMRTFVSIYGSEHIMIALAEPDAATKRLKVTLSGRDAVGWFSLTRAYRLDAGDQGYASELGAVIALGILEGRWKTIQSGGSAVAAGASGGEGDLLITVEFRGMSEWQDISRRLAATPGVEELDVAGLSARGARVTLRYPQGGEQLAGELARQGLALSNVGGSWMLRLQ